MQLLYSDMLPLKTGKDETTFIDCFKEQLAGADRLDIAVGYTSFASLNELDQLVDSSLDLNSITLVIGMYYLEGMPENSYRLAMNLNQKWKALGIGEIRLVKSLKYHGKAYCFYKNGRPVSAIIGSANLGAIKLDANNRRQYELSAFTTDPSETAEIAGHISKLNSPSCSENISEIKNIKLIREANTALDGIELVSKMPDSNVKFYQSLPAITKIILRLKVPHVYDRFLDDGKHFTKSNINVCYAAPRSKRKARDWYESQLTVDSATKRQEGYPAKNQPFFVVTDDGYWFKAHTTSDGNKQFSAVGDELIMGRWLKGRLVAAGIVQPVNNTAEDTDRQGMITKEMLDEYGCDRLIFAKTGQTALDEEENPLDVWLLSFTKEDS